MGKSEYEREREARLRENERQLRALGISSVDTKIKGREVKKRGKRKRESGRLVLPDTSQRRYSERLKRGKEGKEETEEVVAMTDRIESRSRRSSQPQGEVSRQSGTTTHQHTWWRVKTMSEKALLRRIKSIERANGKHALEKMSVFVEVLQLTGKLELAGIAEEALNRLSV